MSLWTNGMRGDTSNKRVEQTGPQAVMKFSAQCAGSSRATRALCATGSIGRQGRLPCLLTDIFCAACLMP